MAATACGGDRTQDPFATATDSAGDSSDSGEPSEEAYGLRVTVRSARETGHIGDLVVTPDDRFVITSVLVENETHSPPVSVAYALFALRTEDGVEFLGAPATELLPMGCGAAQVAEGGMFECSVAFGVPVSQVAAAVVYRPEPEVEIVVEFESTPCDVCGNDCVDVSSDENHCGGCDAAIGAGQVCQEGEPVCEQDGLTICANECVDLQTDRQNCGACGQTALNCVDGEPADPECPAEETLCNNFCVDTRFTSGHCAECNHVCPAEWNGCHDSQCELYINRLFPDVPCDGLCAEQGAVCSSASVRYEGRRFCRGVFGKDWYETVDVGCSDLPDPNYTADGCEFDGDALLRCICTEA